MKVVITEVRVWEVEIEPTMSSAEAEDYARALIRSKEYLKGTLKATESVRAEIVRFQPRRTPDLLFAFLNAAKNTAEAIS